MPHKPVIAITMPLKKQRLSCFFSALFVRMYGGAPIYVTPDDDYKSMAFDGLIISGGTDVYPEYYSGNIKQNYRYDHARDQMELFLLQQAEQRGLPVLGICRGAQLMNVHRKGSLHFDVKLAYEKAEYPSSLMANIFYRKAMFIKKTNSLLGRILPVTKTRVNSIHTQSVDLLGHNLEITGQEQNGVVQAIEDPSKPFFLGVQFHPEYLGYRRRFRHIFKKLVICAKNM